MSKLREALNQLLGLIDNGILVFDKTLEPSDISQAQYHIDKAGEAYEEPLRNCDVGTIREQDLRFDDFCGSQGCDKCPLNKEVEACALCWSQMPYEEVNNG